MKKKGFFLFLLIMFPVLLFLFLKGFGTNQFSIPIYYSNGIGDTLRQVTCLERDSEQYIVKNPQLVLGVTKVIHFERMDGPVLKSRLEELEKVQDVFYDNSEIQMFTYLNNASIQTNAITGYNQRIRFMDQFWHFQALDSNSWSNLKHCGLVMSELDNRVVLVDAKNQIRGYYNIMEREETDRLILELRILQTIDIENE
ncbi:hypothetical protein ACV07N_12665 [Roseivirga echinicomitans]